MTSALLKTRNIAQNNADGYHGLLIGLVLCNVPGFEQRISHRAVDHDSGLFLAAAEPISTLADLAPRVAHRRADDHGCATGFAETTKLCADSEEARRLRMWRSRAAVIGNCHGDRFFNLDGAPATMVSLQVRSADFARKADQMECPGTQ